MKNNTFFQKSTARKTKKQKKKQEKNGPQKNKIKNAYWISTAKMATSTKFPAKDFLSPHRYNLSLRAHLTSS